MYHAAAGAGALSRALGAFAAGDTVTASVWFKAPAGVSGALGIHDGRPGDPADSKRFVSLAGNGAWQRLSITFTLQRADNLWIHLYGDMFTATSANATASTFVDYDDLGVTRNGAAVLQEGFESAPALQSTDPLSTTSYYACAAGLAAVQGREGAPATWNRDVVYLGGRAIAEIDSFGAIHELHTDPLGTPRVFTRGTDGSIEGRQAYAPFGEYITSAEWTDGYVPLTGYTGHLQADPTGLKELIYMGGRYYSPAWHRFLNSDQGVDPNQFNQFAYVGGSPLQAADPSGMETQVWWKVGDQYFSSWADAMIYLYAAMQAEATVEVIGSAGNPLSGVDVEVGNPNLNPLGNPVSRLVRNGPPQTQQQKTPCNGQISALQRQNDQSKANADSAAVRSYLRGISIATAKGAIGGGVTFGTAGAAIGAVLGLGVGAGPGAGLGALGGAIVGGVGGLTYSTITDGIALQNTFQTIQNNWSANYRSIQNFSDTNCNGAAPEIRY
ncbi:MAG: hypothetical protein HY823_01340 [Acidobacteria bacterium]|nr:hypothetical protein [Acidobacteriota bacterium]